MSTLPISTFSDSLTVRCWVDATEGRADTVRLSEAEAHEVHRLAFGRTVLVDTTDEGARLDLFVPDAQVGSWVLISTPDGDCLAWVVVTVDVDPEPDTEDDETDAEARCPACGEPISYCQGHGESGDPDGFDTLRRHDDGDHTDCHQDGCDDAGEDLRPPLLVDGHRSKLAERTVEALLDALEWTEQEHSEADVSAILQEAAFGDQQVTVGPISTPIPQVWIVESVVHEGHPTDASGESCTDECFRELALSTWYPTEERAAAVADELYRQTLTDHQPGLLVLDPENPTLSM